MALQKPKREGRKKYYCSVNGTDFQFSSIVALAHNSLIGETMNPIHYLIAFALSHAVAQVESRGNACAYNKAEDAAGCMQIRPIMVAEAQRLGLNFTLDDRWDCEKSKALFVAIQIVKGRTDPEEMARCWNGGPRGMQKESTLQLLGGS